MSPPDESSSDDAPEGTPSGPDRPSDPGADPSGPVGWWRWFRTTDNEAVTFVREMLESVVVVLAIGLLLFAVSGVWPPMVAVESGSMEPQMERGDLIFVMDEHRLAPGAAQDGTGIVTYQTGQQTGYSSFDRPGDVIIYQPYGQNGETPIIHRAMFWVEKGENWYGEADQSYVGSADSCEELPNCPAPNAGFITKGDNNPGYDQVLGISDPVHPSWVRGTAELKIPWLGHVRLFFSSMSVTSVPDRTPTQDAAPEAPTLAPLEPADATVAADASPSILANASA
ncbi:S26 family signal peptidase [Halomicrococcus gelatinilyticus]|uniref:S26 family signal peptidase n=1 Tax=Halomicrococcus gelatinilyticus TaxID=1702103 RepID=UPI002E100454